MSTSAERMRRLRERRAAALAAVPDAPERDPDVCLLPAVEVTIGALRLGEQDAAMGQITRRLASVIDEAADQSVALRYLGPELFRALESLGATPASRARLPQKQAQRSAPNKIAVLRHAHQAAKTRQRRA